MDLTTRCPRCGTVFEASLADLQLRKGYIRCVQCAHIFDGYAEVVSDGRTSSDAGNAAPEPDLPTQAPSRQEPEFRTPFEPDLNPWEVPDQGVDFEEHTDDEGSSPAHFLSARDVPVTADAAHGRREPLLDSAEDRPGPGAAAPRGHAFIVEADPSRRRSGGSAAPLMTPQPEGLGALFGGALAKVLLVLLLGLGLLQLAYVYRAQLAQNVPALRPALERACASLGCQVPYLRDIGQIAITGSALKAVSANGDGDVQNFVLQLSLRNRAEQPQQWPTLVLDLKDGAGTLVVRRNLAPSAYLGAESASSPFAARSEALLRIPFRVQGVHVNGYQLDLFFP